MGRSLIMLQAYEIKIINTHVSLITVINQVGFSNLRTVQLPFGNELN